MTYINKLPNGKVSVTVVERRGKQWTMTVREYSEAEYNALIEKEN